MATAAVASEAVLAAKKLADFLGMEGLSVVDPFAGWARLGALTGAS
jgi:hypothetical protein